jgi:hypothetical protein
MDEEHSSIQHVAAFLRRIETEQNVLPSLSSWSNTPCRQDDADEALAADQEPRP